jgi:hypothetical protein
MNFSSMNGFDSAPMGADFGAAGMGDSMDNMNSMMFANSSGMGGMGGMGGMVNPNQGMLGGNPFPMASMGGPQGDDPSSRMMAMNHMNMNMNMNMSGAPGNMNMNGQFVPDLDMVALFRAKQNMMNRGRGGSAVQDKMRTFAQEQYAKGQGLPMSGARGGLDGLPISSLMDGNMMAGMKRGPESDSEGHPSKKKKGEDALDKNGKRKKKSKKSTDMPRRALSAYNIFFSEQRELILKEIDEKEGKDKSGEDSNNEDEKQTKEEEKDGSKVKEENEDNKDEEDKDADEDKKEEDEDKSKDVDEEKKEEEKDADEDKKEKEEEGDEKLPQVMNRSFFPKRAKRAHRKVHGKIGLVDLAREVSKRWKELAPEKRKHYQDLAEEDRKKHKEIMAEYQERKAAENMVSMGTNDSQDEDEPVSAPASTGGAGIVAPEELHNQEMPSEQDLRDSMAHQYQQRILAEMMAARRPAQDQFGMMNNFPMMSNRLGGAGGGFQSNMHAMQNMNNMDDMNAMLEIQNQRALMLQRMRMSGMGGMGMDGMGGGMGGMGGGMGGMGGMGSM